MYVEKGAQKEAATSSSKPGGKPSSNAGGKGKKPLGMNAKAIQLRLALPIDDPERLFEGVFINNESRNRKGGRIKCKDFPNKIEVQANMVYQTLHESVVYWKILRKVAKGDFKRKGRGEKEEQPSQTAPKKNFVEKKEEAPSKPIPEAKQLQEDLKKVEKQEMEVEPKFKPTEKEENEEDFEERGAKPQRKRSRDEGEGKGNNDQQKQSEKDSDEEEEKKELDTIIAKIVRVKENPWATGKSIVCTLKLVERPKPLPLPKSPSAMEVIELDNYIDSFPINKRLPKFEIAMLDWVEKQIFAEAKRVEDGRMEKKEADITKKGGKKGGKKEEAVALQNKNCRETRQALKDIIDNYYFVMNFESWTRDDPYPIGKIVKLLKKIKTPEGECEAYLHELSLTDYDHKMYAPVELQISPDHVRYDGLVVFTIDPATSVDLDDALSITKLTETTYEVGIHISDVSSYIGLLDREHISKLNTSVYLPYEVKHMLPHAFVDICTLRPHVDRLAFSVFLTMNEKGEVLQERYEKTIIHSRCQLSYELAQEVIEGKIKQPKDLPERLKLPESDAKIVIDSILLMSTLSTARRNHRCILDVFNKHEIKFELDANNYPTGITLYVRKQAHKMVEEFMILGNEYVAKKLCKSFGGDSLVIHHPPPSELNQQYFNKFFQDYNFKVHFTNMKELQLQIKELIQKGLKKEIEELLILKASRSQELASYALNKNNQDTKEHFALNLESYTHFTSPMRRFADIIAHEQLFMALKNKNYTSDQEKRLETEVLRLNSGRQATKRLKQRIVDSFFCLLIDHTNKTIETKAIITSFGINSVSLFIPEYDLIKEIYWKKEMDIARVDFEEKDRNIMIIQFKNRNDSRQLIKWRAEKHSTVNVEIDCTISCPLEMVFHFNVEVDGKPYRIRGFR